MSKPRIMYILQEYPQISQTYIKCEIDALKDDYDIKVVSMVEPDIPYKNHMPYKFITDPGRIREEIEEFRPHVLHSHWLFLALTLGELSEQTGVPFTIRTHSFDSIPKKKVSLFSPIRWFGKNNMPRRTLKSIPIINDDNCLGILAFPFVKPMLEKAGVKSAKIHESYPVVNYGIFHDTSPNGDAVMNIGACSPKKKMEDFLSLAKKMPEREFNLYAMGYQVDKMHSMNESMGNPVNVIPAIEPDEMPREYKKHNWLVYTACFERATVGWPMAVAEAQAAGLGVCLPNIRPDLREYVGEAGYIYDSIDEVPDIISKPYPEELRQIGFEHAKKSDINEHKVILTDLWQKALVSEPQNTASNS